MNKQAVHIRNLTKTYEKGKVKAVNQVSFEVGKGELFGLIGPDGAGKTTIFRVLATLLNPDSGEVAVEGLDVQRDYHQIRQLIGYMPGKFSLYQDLTIRENIDFFAALFAADIEDNYQVIKPIYEQLAPFADRRAGKLSGGMKQKLALCCALVHKPSILLLDEPTTGVDVVSRREFWDMLNQLKNQGITILVSTPYMDEAMRCERIALIQQGRILSVDTPDQLIRSFPSRLYAAKSADIYHLMLDLRTDPKIESCYAFGEYLHITLKQAYDEEGTPHLIDFARKAGHVEIVVEEIKPGIEDLFIRLTK